MGYLKMRKKIQARKVISEEPASDEEGKGGGEPDLHQCGHCKQMFYNFTKYITHKLQKVCWNSDTTPTEEVAPWSMEGNGSSSPDDAKEDHEDVQQPPQEQNEQVVKNVRPEVQKRKHRKGAVRRVKPTIEETDHVDMGEPMVYIPEDEDTVYVPTESIDEDRTQDNKKESKVSTNSPKGAASKTSAKYGLPLYNYTKQSKKTYYPPSEEKHEHYSPHSERSSPSFSTPHGHHSRIMHSYQCHKRNQTPSFYPEQRLHAEESFYRFQTEYYEEKTRHRSGHASSSGSPNRYKDEAFSRKHDPYRTMANIAKQKDSKHDQKAEAIDYKSIEHDESTTVSISDSTTEKLSEEIAPPELLQISPSSENIGDDSSALCKSPPALEKHETSNAESDLLKTEEDHTAEEQPDDEGKSVETKPKQDDSALSLTTTKYMNMPSPSPEKESNSPPESINSHETEEFTQEPSKETAEGRLPRVRQLSESTVERLITEPSSQADASWKHAKQVYRCPLCAKIFPFKSKLQRHVLVHTGIKPYKCTVCGRGFTQQIDLQRHLTRHTGEKPFKCHLCKAQFIRADNLRKHCKDAHYVNIEEPIRKRRRKTTGSDTVLPPLEVAIALALSETERNGGRVLGRSATRTTTRATATTTKQQSSSRYTAESSGFQQTSPEDRPSGAFRPHMSHPESSQYPSSYPPPLGPRVRYPFPHPSENQQYPPMSRRPRTPPELHQISPPFRKEGRYAHHAESMRYYHQTSPTAPPARGYYVKQRYEREGEPFYAEKDEHSCVNVSLQQTNPMFQVKEYRSMALDHPSGTSFPNTRGTDEEYERGGRPRHTGEEEDGEDSRFRRKSMDLRYAGGSSSSTKASPSEYIQPRSSEEDPSYTEEGMRASQSSTGSASYGPPRSEDHEHRALFRGKQSISYGDYKATISRQSDQQLATSSSSYHASTSLDPGEYVTMAPERETSLIQPRPLSASPGVAETDVYVDEDTPIVTPSDDPSLIAKNTSED